MKKRLLALLMATVTILSAMPLGVLAEETEVVTETFEETKDVEETKETLGNHTKTVVDIIGYEKTLSTKYVGTLSYYDTLPRTVTLVYDDESTEDVSAAWYCDGVNTSNGEKVAKFTLDTSKYQLVSGVSASLVMTIGNFSIAPMPLMSVTKATGGAFDGATGLLSRGGTITAGDYGTWATQHYDVTINGVLYRGYCGKASYSPPNMTTHKVHEITGGTRSSDIVKAILLTNPLTGNYVDPIWSNTFSSKMLWYTHSALSYYWSDDETGTSLSKIAQIEKVADYLYNTWIPTHQEIFNSTHAYYLCGSNTPHANTNSGAYCPSGKQDILFATGEYTPSDGKVKIVKTSANPSLTDNNACYSLEGAVYGVYSDSACTAEVGRLTTDATGNTNELEVSAGTFYVKEISAPKSYLLDANVYTVNVVASQTATVSVTDMPGNDPLGIKITKVGADSGNTNIAPLTGTQFTIKYYDGFYDTVGSLPATATRTWVIQTMEHNNPVTGKVEYRTFLDDAYKVGGDDFYRNFANQPVLPLGTLTVEETKPADGYMIEGGYLQPNGSDKKYEGIYLSQVTKVGDIVSLIGGNEYTMTDYALHGGVAIQKIDKQTGFIPQGMATFDKTTFNVISLNDFDVVVEGNSYSKEAVVMTLTTDEKGFAETSNNVLPYGQYKIVEKDAPTGYLISTEERIFNITENGQIVRLTTELNALSDYVICGGVSIQKIDAETGNTDVQGNATLEGAVYNIINQSKNPVLVNGVSYKIGEVVMSLTTDSKGFAQTGKDVLPFGNYDLVESKAPNGYLLSDKVYSFTVSENEVIIAIEDIAEQVVRGGVSIQKVDAETGKAEPQGNATLEGAIYDIINQSKNPVLVNGTSYKTGEVVMSLTTDKNGYAKTGTDVLPYGEYELIESSAPSGYLVSTKTTMFTVSENEVIVNLEGLSEQIKRGDLELVKIASDHKRLSNVTFKITSKTTGEEHHFVTDENGEYKTSSDFISHSAENGLWFGESEPNDSMGALMYDTYIIEEVRSDGNKGMELIPPFEVIVSKNDYVIHLGTLVDEYTPKIEIHTSASNKQDGKKVIIGKGVVTVVDTVELYGLTVGTEYLLTGWQMVKEENAMLIVDGKEVKNDLTFTADKADMVVEIEYTFDASNLGNIDLVTFEELYDITDSENIEKVAEHKDIEDKDQTVTIVIEDTSNIPDTPKTGFDVRPLMVAFIIFAMSAVMSVVLVRMRKLNKIKDE